MKSLAEDWRKQYLSVKNQAEVNENEIKEKEKTILELEEKCSDLSASLVNHVRNSEAEKERTQKAMVAERETALATEERLRERDLEMELLHEERRKRERVDEHSRTGGDSWERSRGGGFRVEGRGGEA